MDYNLSDFVYTDVSRWASAATESRGKRAKRWVRDAQSRLWLRKECHPSRPFEHVIEALARLLAFLVGLEPPETKLANWLEEGRLHQGVIVRNFLDEPIQEFDIGAVVLEAADRSYNVADRENHTLDRVLNALAALEHAHSISLQKPMFLILVFDAWVGNGDRHPENWGLIKERGKPTKLAPIYDTAACLGAELGDSHKLLQCGWNQAVMSKYVERCPSGFGDGQDLIKMANLMTLLRGTDLWEQYGPEWVANFEKAMTTFSGYLHRVEPLPVSRRNLAERLLEERLRWLKQFT